MGIKDVFGPFNRVVANTGEEKPISNSSLSAILFVSTTEKKELGKHSGAVSTDEISELFTSSEPLKKKITSALSQRDVNGNSITPNSFYTLGINFTEASDDDKKILNPLELALKQITIDYKEKSCVVIFEDSSLVLKKDSLIMGLDTALLNWDSWSILLVKEEAEVKAVGMALISETSHTKSKKALESRAVEELKPSLKGSSRLMGIKAYKNEFIADAALAGRVIAKGVGKVDGEAKTLYGVTSEKLSIVAGNDGITNSEAMKWVDTYNTNIYVQTLHMYDETSGMKLFNGTEFINSWELLKVKVDLSSDLAQFRHEREKVGTTVMDADEILGVLVNRLDILTFEEGKAAALQPNALLGDYHIAEVELDRSLSDNVNKFQYVINVRLRGIAKWFALGITGHTSDKTFDAAVSLLGGGE